MSTVLGILAAIATLFGTWFASSRHTRAKLEAEALRQHNVLAKRLEQLSLAVPREADEEITEMRAQLRSALRHAKPSDRLDDLNAIHEHAISVRARYGL
jgi:hypothetical protein